MKYQVLYLNILSLLNLQVHYEKKLFNDVKDQLNTFDSRK